MATEKYTAATDQSSVLTTQLNALANAAVSAVGAELDNATDKNRYAVAELSVDFVSAPTAKSVCVLYAVIARDGTNYPDVAVPSVQMYVGEFQLDAVTPAQRIMTAPFLLPGPFKTKFVLENRSGQAFPASGSTVKVSTFNRDVS